MDNLINLHSENPHKHGASVDSADSAGISKGVKEKNNFFDYEIDRIIYSTGEEVYKLEKVGEDGKPTIKIITPDRPEFEEIRRQYEQQKSR